MAIHWPTTLVDAGHRRGCTIVDVSRAGARIMLGKPIAPMTPVTLFDERIGAIEATVVWCRGEIAGVAFHSLAPAVGEKLRGLLLALEAAEARTAMERPRPQFGRRTHHGSLVRK